MTTAKLTAHACITGISALILAAGESRRMGQPKALIRLQGKTFLQHIVDNLLNAGIKDILVVLGHHADVIASHCPPQVQTILNRHYALGQFSSLQAGIRQIGNHAQAVLVCLVDQPHISVELMAAMQRAHQQGKIVIAGHGGHSGHPVLYDRTFFPHILACAPVQTAHDLLNRLQDHTERLDWLDDAVLLDADQPIDLERIAKLLKP